MVSSLCRRLIRKSIFFEKKKKKESIGAHSYCTEFGAVFSIVARSWFSRTTQLSKT